MPQRGTRRIAQNRTIPHRLHPSGTLRGNTRRSPSVSVHASWGDITFEYPGVYNYAIHEVTRTDTNIVYDSNVYAAKVTVTRNSDNTLSSSVSYAGSDALLVIQNTTTTGWVQIKATKLLDRKSAKAGQFTFSVTPSDNAPKLTNTTVTNGDNGLINFTVPITLADLNGKDSAKFTYTFREVAAAIRPSNTTPPTAQRPSW